jgi:hypothetical protein
LTGCRPYHAGVQLGPPRRLRYAGLAAALLLAAGAYGAGALPAGDPAAELRGRGLAAASLEFRLGLAACLVGTVGLVAAWWRVGRHVHDDVPGPRWLAVTGALWTLPLLFAPPLGSRDVYSYACQGWLYAHGMNPYAVTPAGGSCPWQASVAPTWRDTPSPYGPLAVALSGAAAQAGGARLVIAASVLRVLALVGAVLVVAAGSRVAAACGVTPMRAAWLGMGTPLVAIHAVSGAHHDALMAGLVVAALAAAVQARSTAPGWVAGATAGLALALAAAVKATALVAVAFVVLLVAGGAAVPGRGGRARAVLAVVGAFGGAFAAVTALTGLGVGWIHALSGTTEQAQWTSMPTAVGMSAGYLVRGLGEPAAFQPLVMAARLVGIGVLGGVLIVLCVRAWRMRTDMCAVVVWCGAAFAAVALLSPVFYAWYAFAPLAVLAVSVTSETTRGWLAITTCGLCFLVLPNGLGIAVLTRLPGAFAVTTLVVVLGWVWLRRRRRSNRRRPMAVG